jgi:hypothetical protein
VLAALAAGCGVLPDVGPDTPEGFGPLAVTTHRSADGVTLDFPDPPASAGLVVICPAAPAGRGDAAGLIDRIRSAGCVEPAEGPEPGSLSRELRFESLASAQMLLFDPADRWLVILVTAGGEGGSASRAYAAWVEGGPILP